MHSHGEWQIELIQSQLIAFKMNGPFNIAGVKSYVEEFKQLAEALSGTRWACYGASPSGDLVVPEALPLFAELSFWMAEHGCCCDIMQVANKVQKYQVDSSVEDGLPEGYELHVVSDTSQAAEILTAQGFPVDESLLAQWIVE